MFRLTQREINKVKSGGHVEVFRRKGGGELWELYKLSHGKPVNTIVCTGVRSAVKYNAVVRVDTAKAWRGSECIYGLRVTVLEIGERI